MNTPPRRFKATAGIDDEMSTLSFFRIRHLFGQKRFEIRARHVAAGHDALALDVWRRGDDEDGVAAPIAARFEEEWYIENRERRPASRLAGKKHPLPVVNQGMDE